MDKKLQDLIAAAINKTERGELQWIAFGTESFRAKIGSGHLHILRGTTQVSNDGNEFYNALTYFVEVSDAEGRIVAEGEAAEYKEQYPLLHQLYETARKSALASDRVIDDMLQTLRGGSRVS